MTSLLLYKSMLLANALQKNKKTKQKKMKTKKSIIQPPNKKITKVGTVMCRICDQEDGEIPIFDNFVEPNIPDDIQHFSGVTISLSDNLSKHMCQNCLDLLNGCIMFREMCQKTNNKLIEMAIKKEKNTESKAEYSNYEADSETEKHDSDGSYNIPSPNFSEDLPEVPCTYCGKDCLNLPAYHSHLKKSCTNKSKIPEKPTNPKTEEGSKRRFLCDVCGKTALSNASLLVHMGIHENVFPFKCEICPYQGRTMDLLKVHKRTHLAEKPFKCTQCPKATTTASNLAKHMRHVHSTNRPYKCNYCEKAFSFQHDMKRHIKDIHLRQGTVDCDLCCKKFNTRKILRGHQWKVHKIKGERQGRLPSYLQCQVGVQNENKIHEGEQMYLT